MVIEQILCIDTSDALYLFGGLWVEFLGFMKQMFNDHSSFTVMFTELTKNMAYMSLEMSRSRMSLLAFFENSFRTLLRGYVVLFIYLLLTDLLLFHR